MSQITIYDTSAIVGDISQLIPDSGTSPVVPTAGGAITVTSTNGINTVGGLNTININLDADVHTSFTGQTVGPVTDDLVTITLNANEAIVITAQCIGADAADYTNNIGGTGNIVAYRAAGGAVVNTLAPAFTKTATSPAALDLAWLVSGNDVILRATGSAGVTYNFAGKLSYTLMNV